MQILITRFAFICLIIIVLMSGYISEILSCQLRRFIIENIVFRHIVMVIMIFVFIMLEGGWSFNYDLDATSNNNWASGNVLDTMLISIGIYAIFIISAKSRLIPNLLFYGLIFIVYMINAHVNYLNSRNMISKDVQDIVSNVSLGLFGCAGIVLAYGFVDYVLYQRAEYKKKFNWVTFMLGVSKCAHIPAS
jgi:hypothetical protein